MEHFPGTENAHPETGLNGFLRVCSYDRTLVRSSGSEVKNEFKGKDGKFSWTYNFEIMYIQA